MAAVRLPRLFKTYAGLDRSIYFLFLAQVVNSIGHFVHPFLTLFLTRKLGMDAGEAGFYVFLSALAWVPSSLAGGKIADSFGRKKTLVLFHTLPALALVPCAFLGASRLVAWLLIAASFLHGLAEPVNDAMLTDLTPPAQRKAAFSLLYLGHNLGVAVGTLFAGFLFNRYLTWFFLGDAATTLAAVVLIAVFVRESAPTREQVEAQLRRGHRPGAGGERLPGRGPAAPAVPAGLHVHPRPAVPGLLADQLQPAAAALRPVRRERARRSSACWSASTR